MEQGALVPRSSFPERLMGALQLNSATYAEVAADREATMQAFAIIMGIPILVALSQFAFGLVPQTLGIRERVIVAVIGAILGAIGALLGLLLTAWLLSIVAIFAVRGSDRSTNFRRLLRTLGFASAPSAFQLLALLPTIGVFIAIAVGIWTLVADIIAIRSALEVTTGRAIAIAITP